MHYVIRYSKHLCISEKDCCKDLFYDISVLHTCRFCQVSLITRTLQNGLWMNIHSNHGDNV